MMGWRCRLWFAGVLLAACASPGEEPDEGKGGAVVDGGGARVITHTAPPDAGAASPPAQVPEVDAAVTDASFQAGGSSSSPGGVVAVSGSGSGASPDAGARRDARDAASASVDVGGADRRPGSGGAGGNGSRGGAGGNGGRGGEGGQSGATGSAGSGGRGAESCESLEARYRVALARAAVCDFFALGPTCQQLADSSLECPGCKIAVDDTSVLADTIARWQSSGCAGRRRDCPAIVCANLHTGLCIPRGDGAVCDGTTAVMPAR
jgi:hypothetical protein